MELDGFGLAIQLSSDVHEKRNTHTLSQLSSFSENFGFTSRTTSRFCFLAKNHTVAVVARTNNKEENEKKQAQPRFERNRTIETKGRGDETEESLDLILSNENRTSHLSTNFYARYGQDRHTPSDLPPGLDSGIGRPTEHTHYSRNKPAHTMHVHPPASASLY